MRNAHILIKGGDPLLLPYFSKSLSSIGFHVDLLSLKQEMPAAPLRPVYSLVILFSDAVKNLVSEIELLLNIQPGIQLLLLTSASEKNARDEMRKLKVERYLLLPCAMQDFVREVEDIFSHSPAFTEELFLDTLTVDTKYKRVKRNGKVMTLTKKEYTLLTFLLKHKDSAVSRADLLEHVWGMQIDPLSNTIEAHILSLRRKIDSGTQTKLIHTVPKYGYRMSTNK